VRELGARRMEESCCTAGEYPYSSAQIGVCPAASWRSDSVASMIQRKCVLLTSAG
jgi:hypothetical protein